MIRVLLADHHQLFHPAIQTILSQAPEVSLTSTVTESSQFSQLCREHLPDVVLLALNVADPLQTDVISQLRQYCPTAAVLVLLGDGDNICPRQLQEAGAAGALLKSEPPEKLIEAILTVANGETWFSAPLILKLLQPEIEEEVPQLTDRELAVLQLLAAEKTAEVIGQALGISERTVRSYLTGIYGKLGVRSNLGAVREAVRLKLIPIE